jgi:alkane 1-monooxygenase
MHGQLSSFAGYLLILLPPVLLACCVLFRIPALAFLILIVVMPFLRALLGDGPARQPEWSERYATALDRLPIVAALAHLAAFSLVIWSLARSEPGSATLIWLGASMWATFIFASCVSHELSHRRALAARDLSSVLSGVIGYPWQMHEHFSHHSMRPIFTDLDCPRTDESVWGFTWRRLLAITGTAREGNAAASVLRRSEWLGGLPLAVTTTAVTALAMFAVAGGTGLVLYIVVAAAVTWTMQAMTYVQHWGLDSGSSENLANVAWEDRCQLQAWLTLNICYHQAHHTARGKPYYRLEAVEGSPKAPAGYVVLLAACLIPPVWRSLMLPALERWKRSPLEQFTAGRRMVC